MYFQLAKGFPSLNSILVRILAALDHQAFVFLAPTADLEQQLCPILDFSPALIIAPALSSNLRTKIAIHNTLVLLPIECTPSGTVIVDHAQSARDLRRIAQLVVRGKFLGLGRLDGSVDRVLVEADRAGELVELVLEAVKAAYGVDASLSADYGRLLGGCGVRELGEIVRKAVDAGDGVVLVGGNEGKAGFFPPTVITAKTS